MTDRQKIKKISELLTGEDAWDNEDEALELAYSLVDPGLKQRTLKFIADTMCTPKA